MQFKGLVKVLFIVPLFTQLHLCCHHFHVLFLILLYAQLMLDKIHLLFEASASPNK